jgi:hypothetical protein
VRQERLGRLKEINDFIGTGIRDLQASTSNVVPQPATLDQVPILGRVFYPKFAVCMMHFNAVLVKHCDEVNIFTNSTSFELWISVICHVM